MKLQAAINEARVDVEIRREDARVFAAVDGRKYELALHESAAGSYLLVSNSVVFDCRAEGRPESGNAVDVVVGTSRYAITLTDPKRLRSANSMSAHADEAARIVAPMPGKIVRVLVTVGDRVDAGAGIIVVEAMKMQNEMKSPKAGTIVSLNVDIGATVNGGDVLAVIE